MRVLYTLMILLFSCKASKLSPEMCFSHRYIHIYIYTYFNQCSWNDQNGITLG